MAFAAGMSPPSSAVRMRVEETGFPQTGPWAAPPLPPQRGAELAQQFRVSGGFGPKGKVFAAEKRFGVAVPHDAQHELLGRHGLDLLKIRAEIMLHAQTFDEGMFILGGEEALAFHLVFGGQFEREYRRGCPVGSCPLDRPLDDGAVANVDAVKKPMATALPFALPSASGTSCE